MDKQQLFDQLAAEAASCVVCERMRERLLVPLYHPSPQVIITVRTLEQQGRDYQTLQRAIRRVSSE